MIKKLFALLVLSTGLSAQSGLNNLDFENWIGNSPAGFFGTGLSQQTASPNSGNKYVRITSNGQSFPNTSGFLVLNGNGNSTMPGVPLATTPTAITGYIRTNMVGQDTVYIVGHLRKSPSNIVGTFFYSTSQTYSSWQQINIPILYFSPQSPDTIQITFIGNKSMMNMKTPNANGTYLELDNFILNGSVPTALLEQQANGSLRAYPNPASQELFIETRQTQGRVEVYDINGRQVSSNEINNPLTRLLLEDYAAGIYSYKVLSIDGSGLHTGKFSVVK